jgi:hypothetical protein
MYHAGVCSMSGSGCEKDPELAFELLGALGDQGFLCAKFAAAVFKGADADEQMEIKREKWLLQKPWTPRVSESWSLSKSNEVQ